MEVINSGGKELIQWMIERLGNYDGMVDGKEKCIEIKKNYTKAMQYN